MNESLFSSSSSLLCFVCNGPFKDPRILPCQHSFCLSCLNFLCDNPTSDHSKKVKLVCPKCTTHFTVPLEGVESFPPDTKLQTLKSKIIDQVAQNISNNVKSSRETLNKTKSSNSNSDIRSSGISANSQTEDANRPSTTMHHNGYSSLYNDYSKYAKYFESNNEQTSFKPTIRPDHAKVGYESSTRFRNRQRSKDRDKPDEYRRRTWYGPTLENRRAQSLSRSSTYTENTKDPKTAENLYKISEDKEHPASSHADKPSYRHSMYADYTNINIPTTPPLSTQLTDPPKPYESPFSRRANLGGPTRPTLSTHRENITSEEPRKQSKERKNSRFSPLRGESKFAYKARKNSPKMYKEKKRISPSPSPQRKKVLRNGGASEEVHLDACNKEAPHDSVLRERVNGGRMDRRQQFMKKQEDLKKCGDDDDDDDHLSSARHHKHSSPRQQRFKTGVVTEDAASHKKQRPRCRSMDARPKSLNKNDFKSASEFKNHLLGMTMKKDWYENIMHGFQKDCINNTQEYEEEDEDKDTHIYDETYVEEDKENHRKKADPLIDEDLITNLRTKYSSSLYTKKSPRHTAVVELGEGVTQVWSYQKNDSGLPSSAIFLPSGGLVIADYGHSCLEFLDSNGHFEHSITGIKPFGMAINRSTNTIIVGDRKGRNIRIFDEFGADVSQLDDFSAVEWLGGIGVRRDGGLVLCDRSKSRVIVCGSSGGEMREFGSYGTNTRQLCMADFIAVDSSDRVIVADSGNHCLKIFDSGTGGLVGVVGERGSGVGQFEWPKGVAVDEDDNIFVADTLNRRVLMLSQQGTFIKCVASNIPEPYNLTYHAGRLAVLHHHLNGLSICDVYELSSGV